VRELKNCEEKTWEVHTLTIKVYFIALTFLQKLQLGYTEEQHAILNNTFNPFVMSL